MSYTVFALKWRPKNFEEVLGQKHVVTTLRSAIESGRLAHAYLFAGPRGVGKTSTARILAKSLNCKDGPTVNPCNKCPSCIEISQGRSFDVIEIDGASNRGIDEIRVLRENVKFPPTSGKYKIYIIDEVHMLTTEAFNALLKTLEEPPEFVKFIFATTHPNKVLPTILSRCQRFDFRRIPVMEIIAQLEKIVDQEKIEIDKDVLFALAKSCDGSLRDAESLLDQLVSFAKEKISLGDVISVLGIVEQEALFEITDKITKKDPKAALELFSNIIDEGKDISVFLTNLIEHFRNLMIAKVAKADSKLIDLPQDICDRLLVQANSFSLEEIFSAFNVLVMTQEMTKRLDSLRIPLEISLVKLAYDKKNINPNPANIENTPRVSPAPKKDLPLEQKEPKKLQDEKIPDLPEPSVGLSDEESLDSIKDSWQNVIDALARIKMSVSTYLNEGSPISLKRGVLTVAFSKNLSLHKEALEGKENRALIERTILEVLNIRLGINFILSEIPVVRNSREDPFVRSALDAFGARVIKEL